VFEKQDSRLVAICGIAANGI